MHQRLGVESPVRERSCSPTPHEQRAVPSPLQPSTKQRCLDGGFFLERQFVLNPGMNQLFLLHVTMRMLILNVVMNGVSAVVDPKRTLKLMIQVIQVKA